MSEKHIVAIGGNGLGGDYERPYLFEYMLNLTGKERPRVCLIPNAVSDIKDVKLSYYQAVAKVKCTPTYLDLYYQPQADLRSFLLMQDVIYVGGGNTRCLHALFREWGVDVILRDAWNQGIVLGGTSAGSITWFEDGITDSVPGPLTPMKCLGFLKGTNCPHYNGEEKRRPAFHHMLREGLVAEGYAAEDDVALHYIGDVLHLVLTQRQGGKAFRLTKDKDGAVQEEILDATFLAP